MGVSYDYGEFSSDASGYQVKGQFGQAARRLFLNGFEIGKLQSDIIDVDLTSVMGVEKVQGHEGETRG